MGEVTRPQAIPVVTAFLDEDTSFGSKELAATGEEGVLLGHVDDALEEHHVVERGVRIREIGDAPDVDSVKVLDSPAGGAGEPVVALGLAQRDAYHLAAAVLGEIERRTGPPAAEVEYPVSLGEAQHAGDLLELRHLSLVEPLVSPRVIAARVVHVGIEEQLEDPGMGVVVNAAVPRRGEASLRAHGPVAAAARLSPWARRLRSSSRVEAARSASV